MSRREDIPESIWDQANDMAAEWLMPGGDGHNRATDDISRAIMAATEAERQRCIEAAEYVKTNIVTSIPGRSRFSEWDLNHTFKDACRIVIERIDGSWDQKWKPEDGEP